MPVSPHLQPSFAQYQEGNRWWEMISLYQVQESRVRKQVLQPPGAQQHQGPNFNFTPSWDQQSWDTLRWPETRGEIRRYYISQCIKAILISNLLSSQNSKSDNIAKTIHKACKEKIVFSVLTLNLFNFLTDQPHLYNLWQTIFSSLIAISSLLPCGRQKQNKNKYPLWQW